MIVPGSGQTLLFVEIQLQPGLDHIDVMFNETKRLLDYVQELDPTAKFMSRGLGPKQTTTPTARLLQMSPLATKLRLGNRMVPDNNGIHLLTSSDHGQTVAKPTRG
jgi:hypothetical protein